MDDYNCYNNLAKAIVIQAIAEWRKAKKRHNTQELESLERFFNSEWCAFLSDMERGSILPLLEQNPTINSRAFKTSSLHKKKTTSEL